MDDDNGCCLCSRTWINQNCLSTISPSIQAENIVLRIICKAKHMSCPVLRVNGLIKLYGLDGSTKVCGVLPLKAHARLKNSKAFYWMVMKSSQLRKYEKTFVRCSLRSEKSKSGRKSRKIVFLPQLLPRISRTLH